MFFFLQIINLHFRRNLLCKVLETPSHTFPVPQQTIPFEIHPALCETSASKALWVFGGVKLSNGDFPHNAFGRVSHWRRRQDYPFSNSLSICEILPFSRKMDIGWCGELCSLSSRRGEQLSSWKITLSFCLGEKKTYRDDGNADFVACQLSIPSSDSFSACRLNNVCYVHSEKR